METLYRKVSVNERNPNDSGYYFGIDSLGNREYPYFDKDENKWESIWETVYWLEEITDTSHQIENLETDKKELLALMVTMKDSFDNKAWVTSMELQSFSKRIESLIQKT